MFFQYEAFYGKQFSGRKLTWLHHLSNGDVKLGYLSKTYIVNMSTFQVTYSLCYETIVFGRVTYARRRLRREHFSVYLIHIL